MNQKLQTILGPQHGKHHKLAAVIYHDTFFACARTHTHSNRYIYIYIYIYIHIYIYIIYIYTYTCICVHLCFSLACFLPFKPRPCPSLGSLVFWKNFRPLFCTARGLSFKESQGFGVLGFRVQGLGFRVEALGFKSRCCLDVDSLFFATGLVVSGTRSVQQ